MNRSKLVDTFVALIRERTKRVFRLYGFKSSLRIRFLSRYLLVKCPNSSYDKLKVCRTFASKLTH